MSTALSRAEHVEVKNKVKFYLEVHRFDAAEKLLKATLSRNAQNAGLNNLLGVTYHKQSRFSDAIKQFQTAISINPNYVEAALNLASTYCDVSRYDDARAVFAKLDEAINKELQVPQLIVGRLANQHAENGRVYAQAGLTQEAVHEFKKALELFPKLPDVKYQLAQMYIREEAYEKARAELEELVLIKPEMTDAHNLLGISYYKSGRDDLARKQWKIAAGIDPEDLASRLYMKSSSNW